MKREDKRINTKKIAERRVRRDLRRKYWRAVLPMERIK